jgi:hypothetical protein
LFSCSLPDAAFEASGVYVNGKFYADKYLKVYENSLNSSESKKLWLPVIEKSIAKCEKCGEKSMLRAFHFDMKSSPSEQLKPPSRNPSAKLPSQFSISAIACCT